MKSSKKPLLLTGIQPTNRLTLGNYLGAIKKIVQEQDNYNCYIFAADWHSTTIPISLQPHDYQEISKYTHKVIKMYVACGINPNKSRIFVQSQIKEHLELFYFLLTHSSLGELQRMTQYKHLVKKFTPANQTEMSLVGLLVYPVLMAADILIYDTDYVSIGEDQTQHLELTINIAQRINSKYKQEIFKIPHSFNPIGNKAGVKIKDLQNPEIKMSKSSESHEGVIFLDDSPEIIKNKIMKAKTDSIGKINLDKENQPGIYNLLEIYGELTGISVQESFERLKNNTYKELKEVVAEIVVKELSGIQKNYESINEDELMKIVEQNNKLCVEQAKQKLEYIYKHL